MALNGSAEGNLSYVSNPKVCQAEWFSSEREHGVLGQEDKTDGDRIEGFVRLRTSFEKYQGFVFNNVITERNSGPKCSS